MPKLFNFNPSHCCKEIIKDAILQMFGNEFMDFEYLQQHQILRITGNKQSC